MKLGFRSRNLDSSPAQYLDGSFRRSESVVSPSKSVDSSTSKFVPSSRRVFKALKEYAKKVINVELFVPNIEDWIHERTGTNPIDNDLLFKAPFLVDELQKLDYALEGVVFQQLFRMPCTAYASDELKEDKLLALEDFLHAIADGLWRTFWSKSGPLPFFVCCPRYPGSKLYTVEKAASRGRIGSLSGAALIAKTGKSSEAHWDQVVELALFKSDVAQGVELGFSASTIAEALFYGFHVILSRSLSKFDTTSSNTVYFLVLDPKFGGVIKVGGELSNLEINTSNPYKSIAEWIKNHAEVNVSPVDLIWNKFGNPNWGDLGTLQLILATFYSIVQFKGPPKKSVATLVADHNLRLEKRRFEYQVPEIVDTSTYERQHAQSGEIVELECEEMHSFEKKIARLKLNPGDIMVLEDLQGQKSFQIQEILISGNCLSYSAICLEHPGELLTVYVGSHPSRLKPSWEDMSLWYQVQRQTKVLNIMKQQGVSSKFLPEIVASGRIVHPGPCQKQDPSSRCDHPWCGTPVLVTFPVGEPLSSIVARDGPFASEEALRCCRDCLSALRSAALANIQHGDICPENILRVHDSSECRYVPVSWGHAVLDDRDSPAVNLQFSSTHALQQGKLCPASDAESLVYLLYFVCGGLMQQQDSIESALQWREKCWAKRSIQQQLGEVSALLKAFADYVDSLCGTPYPVDYEIWLRRLNKIVNGGADKGKLVEMNLATASRSDNVAESSGTSGGPSC
ncbi:uncharacterized protein LOC116266595 [Nymphaea colorata]|nr:uncharacterized protein LOC116266595 [Nymphaea colorata]